MKKQTQLSIITCTILLVIAIGSTTAQKTEPIRKKAIKQKMLKVASWQFLHSNGKPENTWTNATFYAGVWAAYKSTKNKSLLDSLMAIGQRNQWQPGKRFDHADDIAITQTYADLYQLKKDEQILAASRDSIRKMMTTAGKEIKTKGINWWWCDALFMAPPTLAKLAAIDNDDAYLKKNDSLYKECYQLLFNPEEHLFARDASYLIDVTGKGKLESNGKKIFWSRGNGWVMAGLARLLEEMPETYPQRPFYTSLFQEMAQKLLSLQQEDGLWRTSLLDPDAYSGGEGSGSAFFCYAFAWGINHKLLNASQYRNATLKTWTAINGLLNQEGRYGWVQPIGADPRRNFGPNSWESFGSGAYLLAASEILKLRK